MLKPVVFQVPYPPYNAGETAGVPVDVADRLLASGRAVPPGAPLRVAVPRPVQGSVPQPVTCGACGATFMPTGERHQCVSAALTGAAVFEAGFNQQRRGRRGR
jgi:hypothetical protein